MISCIQKFNLNQCEPANLLSFLINFNSTLLFSETFAQEGSCNKFIENLIYNLITSSKLPKALYYRSVNANNNNFSILSILIMVSQLVV